MPLESVDFVEKIRGNCNGKLKDFVDLVNGFLGMVTLVLALVTVYFVLKNVEFA